VLRACSGVRIANAAAGTNCGCAASGAHRIDDRQAQLHEDTEQALRDREARLRAILDTAVDGIVTIDELGVIESVNRSAERMFGYTSDETVGQNVSILMPLPYRHEHDRYLADYLKAGEGKIIGIGREVVGLRKDGTTFPMDLAVSEVWLGERRLFTGILRDITQRKWTEERLLQAERLAAIGEAMAGLAHESRNALQRSQACLEMLSRRVENLPDAVQLIQGIQKAQDDLHQLYEDVREYAAPIKLNPGGCDVSAILREAWEHLQVKRNNRNIRINEVRRPGSAGDTSSANSELDLHCEVDAFALRQSLRNVLENSLAACSDPVEIEVEYTQAQINGQPAVQIAICDNGPGLTPDARSRIFDAFYTTKTHGTGLGMAIAKRFIDAQGGQIEVGPSQDRGAEIRITLPKEMK
jgi:PAS domain S-box-containing protein